MPLSQPLTWRTPGWRPSKKEGSRRTRPAGARLFGGVEPETPGRGVSLGADRRSRAALQPSAR